MNQEMDAVYLLSPLSHIVDCLMADLERRRYRKFYVIWTSGSSLEPGVAQCLSKQGFMALTLLPISVETRDTCSS